MQTSLISASRIVDTDDTGPDSPATTNLMAVDDTFRGTLDRAGDTDWVALTLQAGQSVQIDLWGESLKDPYLRLFDGAGRQLASNDDAGGSLNSQIVFVAATSTTYYVVADSYLNSGAGTYAISVVETHPLDAIDWGTQLAGNAVSVFFAPAGFTADGVTSEGFNAYERGQFQRAFDTISDVTNLTFKATGSAVNADFTLLADTNEITVLGYFNPPGIPGAGTGVFGVNSWDRKPGGDLEQGGSGFATIVHELLHGLGMAHPHDGGGTSNIMAGLTQSEGDTGHAGLNQGVYTVMSYNSGLIDGPGEATLSEKGNFSFEGGPMALDIAVLQEKYGVNMTTNRGNTTYLLDDTNGLDTMWMAIWDAGGTDTIRYNGLREATINLQAATLGYEKGGGGVLSFAAGIAGGFTIANGVVIEAAMGGVGGDRLIGNAADNLLVGRGGLDRLFGVNGHDTLIGGFGDDTLLGGMGNDQLLGGFQNDRLDGGSQHDTLIGDNGDDVVIGGPGRDVAYMGDGDDTFIDNGQGGWLGADRVFGGYGNDSIAAGGGNDSLFGGTGSDTIGGGNGEDRILGASGNDRIWAGNQDDRVHAGFGRDTVFLGAGDDVFEEVGQSGFMGADRVFGGAGEDEIGIGGGNDTVTGGTEADTFIFLDGLRNIGANVITDYDPAQDIIIFTEALWQGDLNADQVRDTFADVINGHVLFDFGAGNSVVLNGLADTGLVNIVLDL